MPSSLYLHGRLPRVEEIAVYLDSAAIFLTITGVILAVYGAQVAGLGLAGAAVTVAYPIVHLAMAGGGLVILVASGARPRFGGAYLILVGFAILGVAWVAWLQDAAISQPPAGSIVNDLFSLGILAVGAGGATLRGEADTHALSLARHGRPRRAARLRPGRQRAAHRDEGRRHLRCPGSSRASPRPSSRSPASANGCS